MSTSAMKCAAATHHIRRDTHRTKRLSAPCAIHAIGRLSVSIMVAGHELTGGARPRMMSAKRYMLAQEVPNFLGEYRTSEEPGKHQIRQRRWRLLVKKRPVPQRRVKPGADDFLGAGLAPTPAPPCTRSKYQSLPRIPRAPADFVSQKPTSCQSEELAMFFTLHQGKERWLCRYQESR
jgi:hypothetical protein